jgi:hypothetical protein
MTRMCTNRTLFSSNKRQHLRGTASVLRVDTMVYNTQRYWVFGLCTSSGIFLNNNEKTQRFGNWICFSPQVREDTYSVCPLERANLNHWTTDITIH